MATTTAVNYRSKTVPLGGMGQWAGTYGGGAGQTSPLNAIRNGTGRYNTYADYQASQQGGTQNGAQLTPGTLRPMAPFRDNLVAVQGTNIQAYTTTLQNADAVITFQGNYQTGVTVTAPANTALFTSPTTIMYGKKGQGGNGGSWSGGLVQGAQPGGTGGSAVTILTSSVNILNYGTIQSGGGGGGGGATGFVSGTPRAAYSGGGGGGGQNSGAGGASIGPIQGQAPINAQPGQVNANWNGGTGGFSKTQTGNVSCFAGPGGPAGGFGAAGAAGQNTIQATQIGPRGNGGAAGTASVSPGTGATVTYIVQGTHN